MSVPDFSVEAKTAARAHLGMASDEPNSATGFATRQEFERIALIFDSGSAEGDTAAAEAIFARITDLPKKGNTYQVHVSDLLEIMAEHGLTE